MYRIAIEDLIKWKDSEDRKPMIIKGARQVGKTWLMKEFGDKYYSKCVYISMDENPRMEKVFSDAFDIKRIILHIEIEAGFKITPEDTLIIFDEIQEIPRALKSLKYFYENAPEYHIIAAGSLLGVALHKGTSFPVGKVDFLNLYPLNYREFLMALGQDSLCELLDTKDYSMISTFNLKYIDYLKLYYYIGGMPEVVADYVKNRDINKIRELQNKLLTAYENDFSKHAPVEIVTKIRMVWNSIPIQLAKENKKFIYGVVREGARARDLEVAIMWLMDAGLIYKVNRIKKPDFPILAYTDLSIFKIYMVDIGLLGAMSNLSSKVILEGDRLFEEFKGAITEQYVLQQLVIKKDIDVLYWAEEKATAEVDFVVQLDNVIVPIEVKATENLRAKSLKRFVDKYNNQYAIRTSMSDYREQEWMTNVPLYCIEDLEHKNCD